jgi:hypothetical protein
MERPAPFQPPAPRSPSGWSLSLGLHGLMLLAAFWYVTQRPVLVPLPPILPVELVTMMPAPIPVSRPGAAGPRASAPRQTITPPQPSATPQEDALTARLKALSQLRAPDGPLRRAWAQAVLDIHAGAEVQDVLKDLDQRLGLRPFSVALLALRSAERAGMDAGVVLGERARQAAAGRFARAERLARAAPLKLWATLMLCIAPCTLIVLAFPVAQLLAMIAGR